MKKVAVLLLSIILLFCACDSKETVEPVLNGISFSANIDYNGYKCTCSVKAFGGGVFICEIESPALIKGTTLEFDGNKLTLSFMGIKYEPQLPLPCENMAEILKTVIDSAQNGIAGKNPEGHYEIKGRTGEYEYIVTVAQTGLPVKIECADINFTAEISNVNLL